MHVFFTSIQLLKLLLDVHVADHYHYTCEKHKHSCIMALVEHNLCRVMPFYYRRSEKLS